MRTFIITSSQVRKLPRWGLLLVCVLYVLPGLLGRDPWRVADAAGFGIAFTMFEGTPLDWLVPNVAGQTLAGEGPLPFALAAGFAKLMSWIAPALEGLIPGLEITPHLSIRLAAIIGLSVMLAANWYAIYLLTRRPGVAPSDPLGVGANATDFARAMADSGLLILIATFGLIARMHETTAVAAQMTLIALFILGLAMSLDSPTRGTVLAALAIAATTATRGLPIVLPMLLTWLALLWICQPFTLVRATALKVGMPLLIGASLIWPAFLIANGSTEAIEPRKPAIPGTLCALVLLAGLAAGRLGNLSLGRSLRPTRGGLARAAGRAVSGGCSVCDRSGRSLAAGRHVAAGGAGRDRLADTDTGGGQSDRLVRGHAVLAVRLCDLGLLAGAADGLATAHGGQRPRADAWLHGALESARSGAGVAGQRCLVAAGALAHLPPSAGDLAGGRVVVGRPVPGLVSADDLVAAGFQRTQYLSRRR